MIRVIGNYGCSRCEITKKILGNKGVEYTYEHLSDLSEEEQDELMQMAKEQGLVNMPLILKDGKLAEIKEI